MRRYPALDWRRLLIYTHRWLGIAGCLVFLMWFVSGVVMMYQRMPRLTAEERLARLPPLDPSRLRVDPAVAAARAGVVPDRVRVGMFAGRPVYRFHAAGAWSTAYADTGEPLRDVTAAQALTVLRQFLPEHAGSMRAAGRLEAPDQWTLDGGLPRFLPMQRISMGDSQGTDVYVSARTGEAVMKTTARGRIWGYLGAVLHWTYFTPFRQQRELWRYTIIYAALAGCVMCLSGLAAGIWRFSPRKRFRLRRQPSHSPYAGWMWWHHYAGLLFGLFSFTWALSGALSLTPWDWAPSTDPSDEQRLAMSGGALKLADVSAARLTAAAAALSAWAPVKELELMQFDGRPFAASYQAPAVVDARRAGNPDVSAIFSPSLAMPRRLVRVDDPARTLFARFDPEAVVRAARASMPGLVATEETWLGAYDDYYYDRSGARPLPVLRARYDDADGTWLYVDPQSGLIAFRQTRRSRLNRWLYNGLHSLDLPFLYENRPLWDVVLLVLSAGGMALTVTTMVPAWRRLRRHARAMRVRG